MFPCSVGQGRRGGSGVVGASLVGAQRIGTTQEMGGHKARPYSDTKREQDSGSI